MNKIKNLWANNRILFILGVILVACAIAIIVVVMTFFMGAKKSVYGNRFDNMKTHIKKAEQKAYTSALEERSGVEKVSLRVNNKTLMISVTVKDDIKLDDAKKIVEESLDKFSEDVKETYDMNFTLSGKLFNTIMGAKNVAGSKLSWGNNTPIETSK